MKAVEGTEASNAGWARHVPVPVRSEHGRRALMLGLLRVLVWPALCLLIWMALSTSLETRLDAERRDVRVRAEAQVQALAQAYARQVESSIRYVDQLTLLIKHQWEASPAGQRERTVLLPPTGTMQLMVTNARGRVVAASDGVPTGLSLTGPGLMHPGEGHPDGGLTFVHDAPDAGSLKLPPVRFSRALTDRGGAFDGLVVAALQADDFTRFYQGTGLGSDGMLALADHDGHVWVLRIGARTYPGGETMTGFTTALDGPVGLRRLQRGEHLFPDGKARLIAWQRVEGQPFMAVAGIPLSMLEGHLAPLERRTSDELVWLGVLLSFFCIALTAFNARQVWQRHRDKVIDHAYRIATDRGSEAFFIGRAIRDRNGVVQDYRIEDCNAHGAGWFNSTRRGFIGRHIGDIFKGPGLAALLGVLAEARDKGYYEDEVCIEPGSPLHGRFHWLARRLVATPNDGVAVVLKDISQTKAHAEELSRMANQDPVTGLPNRNWLMRELQRRIDRPEAAAHPFALLFVDLDDFKIVNDTLGHEAGDKLLAQVGSRLSHALRPTDIVVRLGGDEFTLILDDVVTEDDASSIAHRTLDSLAEPCEFDGHKVRVLASVGVSFFPRNGVDALELLRASDIAMYQAKSDGKGGLQFYRPELFEALKDRIRCEQEIAEALERDEFIVYYQPRFDTYSRAPTAMEALARWRHPERGMVPPVEFIPVAERSGQILKLGEIVIDKACAQLRAWRDQGLPLVPVSLNVSPIQLRDSDVAGTLERAMRQYQIEPELVEVEVTESSMLEYAAAESSNLARMRAMGVRLLVDDFGTGYSSLSQLQRLDVDVLKVDRSFTSGLGQSKESTVLVQTIISMAHSLNIYVVAEGVETEEQLRLLVTLSCDEVQGYLLSPPAPPEKMEAWLREVPTADPSARIRAPGERPKELLAAAV